MFSKATLAVAAAALSCVVPGGSTAVSATSPVPPPLPPLPTEPTPPPPPAVAPVLPCTKSGSVRADVLRGTAGNQDVLCGRAGADRIHLAGNDAGYGGAGNDTFYARNGKFDIVVGGAGRDRARVDASDLVVGVEQRL